MQVRKTKQNKLTWRIFVTPDLSATVQLQISWHKRPDKSQMEIWEIWDLKGSRPKFSRLKCGEFQDGNFKPVITKIHKERRYLVLFFNAAVVAAAASNPKYMIVLYYSLCSLHTTYTYTTAKNRAIGDESLKLWRFICAANEKSFCTRPW